MKTNTHTGYYRRKFKKISVCFCVHLWLVSLTFLLVGCDHIRSPKPEIFIGNIAPPRKQEFRWSNGKLPKSFDPAKATASPETDVVRAIYEGLTDLDSKSLEPISAIAEKWTSTEDYKVWTFQLRSDAKWSNGETVTSQDFVRSWKRLAELGAKVSQRDLLKNIVGMDTENALPIFANSENDIFSTEFEVNKFSDEKNQNASNSNTNTANNLNKQTPVLPKVTENLKAEKKKTEIKSNKVEKKEMDFGVEAVSPNILKVTLKQSDQDFPTLVAHPIFRAVYGEEKEFENTDLTNKIVTNGAFRVVSIDKDGIALERSENYWNKNEVELEKVRFVPTENAENALAAYKNGEIDVITNANFAPLALKLLTPFDEFRRTKHSALNFYEFNLNQKPFSDLRVREALTIGFERERLTEDEMDGATEPALNYLPFNEDSKISQDVEKAKKLMAEAGFAGGQNFPTIRLLINRNDLQKRIARSVAKMWKKNLNVETEIIIKDSADFQAAILNGEFDVVRRGIVMPTADEMANILAIFQPRIIPKNEESKKADDNNQIASNQILNDKTAESNLNLSDILDETQVKNENPTETVIAENKPLEILNQKQAMEMLPAIPLYFPSSYSLVKPYIQGFDSNALDAPSLKNVKIDNNWQPTNQKIISN